MTGPLWRSSAPGWKPRARHPPTGMSGTQSGEPGRAGRACSSRRRASLALLEQAVPKSAIPSFLRPGTRESPARSSRRSRSSRSAKGWEESSPIPPTRILPRPMSCSAAASCVPARVPRPVLSCTRSPIRMLDRFLRLGAVSGSGLPSWESRSSRPLATNAFFSASPAALPASSFLAAAAPRWCPPSAPTGPRTSRLPRSSHVGFCQGNPRR